LTTGRLGKLKAEPHALVAAIDESGFLELPLRALHAARVADLPLHHTDSFRSTGSWWRRRSQSRCIF